jgi:hypothetical protein
MKKHSIIVLLFASIAMSLASCDKEDKNNSGTAKVSVRLTDGPGNYDEVNIDIQQIEIHSDNGGWTTISPIVPGVYNLLDFSNGLDTLLCEVDLPAGHISQIRLVLGNNNSVVVDGVSHPLSTPSAQQSGLKFNLHQELVANGSYKIWIDFDAGRSIVAQGNGNYSLKPVVRAYSELTDGRINGIILPDEANAVVYAINGVDTLSAIPNDNGNFMFCGLPEATYKLWIDADDATVYNDSTITNVPVVFGQIKDVGTITLIP